MSTPATTTTTTPQTLVVNPAPGLVARILPPLAWIGAGVAIGYFLGHSQGKKKGANHGGG